MPDKSEREISSASARRDDLACPGSRHRGSHCPKHVPYTTSDACLQWSAPLPCFILSLCCDHPASIIANPPMSATCHSPAHLLPFGDGAPNLQAGFLIYLKQACSAILSPRGRGLPEPKQSLSTRLRHLAPYEPRRSPDCQPRGVIGLCLPV